MRTVHMIRGTSTVEGTPGILCTDKGFICRTIECPDYMNIVDYSCINKGKYAAVAFQSDIHGYVYQIINVTGRTAILFHVGNWAGDSREGYRTDSKGCILLGDSFMMIHDQMAVRRSRSTVKAFMEHMDGKPFNLIIEDI